MIVAASIAGFILLWLIRDHYFSKDNIIRNFPILGHLRYLLIEIGPELRQYIVAHNREEQPFNREEREWIYSSSKGENNMFGFGTDDLIYGSGYPIIKHSVFPATGSGSYSASIHDKKAAIPSAKVIGQSHNRAKPWRPESVFNISAMSFGSLSAKAIEALNKGAAMSGCYHNTGEGGMSDYHKNGADVVYQVGTAYFGCRDAEGNFSIEKLKEKLATYDKVRAVEIKLSQGAKPGKGGVLPSRKITKEISRIRDIPMGKDCLSPSRHSAFNDIDSMLTFVEMIAKETGLPVGIKSAIGQINFWEELAEKMQKTGTGPDFITIDGGEGGTGAAPLTFADHVALPYKIGFARVYQIFLDKGITEDITWIGSGKLGFPDRAIVAFAMGADMINIAREAMLSIGCIQALKCHTDKCPAGIATQNPWLKNAINPKVHSLRYARFVESLRNEVLAVTHSCGYEHPAQFNMEDIELSVSPGHFKTLKEIHGYELVRERSAPVLA